MGEGRSAGQRRLPPQGRTRRVSAPGVSPAWALCAGPGPRVGGERARARPGGPAHTAAAWEAAAAQPLARPPPARPSPLTHSPRPAARAEGATGQKQGGPAVRRAAIGAGGSAPPAASACGRSRTRRRSALSGSRPALLRGGSRRGLETPSLPLWGPLLLPCPPQFSWWREPVRTRAPKMKTFTVLLSLMLCSCLRLC